MWSYGLAVRTLDSESRSPSSNLGRTFFFFSSLLFSSLFCLCLVVVCCLLCSVLFCSVLFQETLFMFLLLKQNHTSQCCPFIFAMNEYRKKTKNTKNGHLVRCRTISVMFVSHVLSFSPMASFFFQCIQLFPMQPGEEKRNESRKFEISLFSSLFRRSDDSRVVRR